MWAKQSTAATLIVGPILDSTGAEYTSAVIGDLSISKNGGTLTAMASAATLTHIANGQYTLVTTTGNLDTLGRAQITCNKSTYQMPTVNLMVVPANVYDSIVLGSDALDVSAIQFAGQTITAAAGVTVPSSIASPTNITAATGVVLSGVTHTGAVIPTVSSVTNGVTVTTNNDKTGYTASTVSDKTGYSLLATTGLGNQTANITGNLSGSVGSVTGAVGSVTAAVAVSDKTGFKLASDGLALVTAWTVGITGNITGNLSGSVGSVTGAVTVGTINADVITASALAGDAATEIATAVWATNLEAWPDDQAGSDLYEMLTTITTISGRMPTLHYGVAQAGGASTITLNASASSITDYYAGLAIAITASTGAGQVRTITAYNGTTKVATVDSAWTTNPADGSSFAIIQAAGTSGGGGGTDWTANERTAIRSILGFDSSGTVSLPTVGVMDAIKDKTDLITSDGISVLEDRVNESTITMQYNESTTATVNLDENTTSATLQFVVSRPDGTDILTIANGSITRTSTSFTVTITTAVTATLGQYLWSLRDITGGTNRVVTKGVLTVQNAASV
jgi:hypothetical protein